MKTHKILHVTTSLGTGGAEITLKSLVLAGRAHGFLPTVVSLRPPGPISEELAKEGVQLHHLDATGPADFAVVLARLRRIVAETAPSLVQGWMYHGNIAASLACFRRAIPVVWNIRASLDRQDMFPRTTRSLVKLSAHLSRYVDGIIYNSQESRRQHERAGFCVKKGIYIPNGVRDLGPTSATCVPAATRARLGIAPEDLLLLCLGRAHPIKGHEVLLSAFTTVMQSVSKAHLLIVGRGVSWTTVPYELYQTFKGRITLLDETHSIHELLNSADIFINPSHSEGFPNALAEALSFGLPCVATNVGESAILVADSGKIVRPGDPKAMASAIMNLGRLSSAERDHLRRSTKARIAHDFSARKFEERYSELYRSLARDA